MMPRYFEIKDDCFDEGIESVDVENGSFTIDFNISRNYERITVTIEELEEILNKAIKLREGSYYE